jgi:hypothetical protein
MTGTGLVQCRLRPLAADVVADQRAETRVLGNQQQAHRALAASVPRRLIS